MVGLVYVSMREHPMGFEPMTVRLEGECSYSAELQVHVIINTDYI